MHVFPNLTFLVRDQGWGDTKPGRKQGKHWDKILHNAFLGVGMQEVHWNSGITKFHILLSNAISESTHHFFSMRPSFVLSLIILPMDSTFHLSFVLCLLHVSGGKIVYEFPKSKIYPLFP